MSTSLQIRVQAARKAAATRKRLAEANPSRLSPRQRALLAFIVEFRAGHGYAPSLKEMQARLGYAGHGTVGRMLVILTARGLITRVLSAPRTIVPTPRALSIVNGASLTHSHETKAA